MYGQTGSTTISKASILPHITTYYLTSSLTFFNVASSYISAAFPQVLRSLSYVYSVLCIRLYGYFTFLYTPENSGPYRGQLAGQQHWKKNVAFVACVWSSRRHLTGHCKKQDVRAMAPWFDLVPGSDKVKPWPDLITTPLVPSEKTLKQTPL